MGILHQRCNLGGDCLIGANGKGATTQRLDFLHKSCGLIRRSGIAEHHIGAVMG